MKFHQHEWKRVYRQSSPPVDIFDCGCGERRRVYQGMDAMPDIEEVVPNPGGSIENCVVKFSGEFVDSLGDRQAERLRMLIQQTEQENG